MALKYWDNSAGEWKYVNSRGQKITVNSTAPSSPDVGDIWIDSDEFQTLPSSNSFVMNEVPTGSVNSSNTTFVTGSNYIAGSLEVYINGLKQAAAHVTETTPSSGTFDLDVAPTTGDVVDCTYQVAADPYSGNADTLDGYHANATPTANTIPVLDSDGELPLAATPSEIWWEELGRDAVSSGTTMSVSFTAKKYLKIIIVDTGSNASGTDLKFNGDSGANYATSRTLQDSAFSSAVSQTSMEVMGNYKGAQMTTIEMFNIAAIEKVLHATWVTGPQGGTQNSAAQLPAHGEYVNKWVNTSNQITSIQLTRRGGAYAAGSEIVVLGHN